MAIKSCPFCGGKGFRIERAPQDTFTETDGCPSCGFFLTPEEWDTRTPPVDVEKRYPWNAILEAAKWVHRRGWDDREDTDYDRQISWEEVEQELRIHFNTVGEL